MRSKGGFPLPNQCHTTFNLAAIYEEEIQYGRFEFICRGCYDYNDLSHKSFVEEAKWDFLGAEYACYGAAKEGVVQYVFLDSWVEGQECSTGGRRIDVDEDGYQ